MLAVQPDDDGIDRDNGDDSYDGYDDDYDNDDDDYDDSDDDDDSDDCADDDRSSSSLPTIIHPIIRCIPEMLALTPLSRSKGMPEGRHQ